MSEPTEPTVVMLGTDLYMIKGLVGRMRDKWSRASWQSEVVMEEKKLWARKQWGDPEIWYVSDSPDAPITYPKPKIKALTTARYKTAQEAVRAAQDWLMEREALVRLGAV